MSQLDNVDNLIIIAGVSGAGKSTAINVLSDLGFYIVDNLPVPLLHDFLQITKSSKDRFKKIALIPDVSSSEKVSLLMNLKDKLTPKDLAKIQLVFLDCNYQTITKRYSESRRPHPAFDPKIDKTIEDSFKREKDILTPLKESANIIIDTSSFTSHILKREIFKLVESISHEYAHAIRINFLSFGFKHGIPLDCDLLADVRFLANPFFIENLRPKTGLDPEVADFVLSNQDAQTFIEKYSDLINFLIPKYISEGKAYLNICIGCTGGQHRSVAIAEKLKSLTIAKNALISIRHRDISQ